MYIGHIWGGSVDIAMCCALANASEMMTRYEKQDYDDVYWFAKTSVIDGR